MNKKFPFLMLFILWFLLLSLLTFKLKGLSNERAVFKTRAQSGGIDAIQQQINAASDGSTITIPAGTYSGSTAVPLGLGDAIWVSDSRGASEWCFLRIENKKITVKGNGAIIFGEGHDKPYQDPYQHRAGVCVINSKVTFDGLRIKEFQKRCMVVYNSTIVYKNGTVDGCDEGGISMLGNSSGLIVNNMICCHNFGGVMLWQNSQAKIINNIFHDAAVMFFYHPNTNDQAKAEIINNIFSGGHEAMVQVDWWKGEAGNLKNNKVSYNLISSEKQCDPSNQICDFPGKIIGDPLYVEPVVDPRGIAAWANFGFKEGSPAVGVGDPSIPGTKTLGNAGGPCADPNSSICNGFISANIPKPFPAPTENPNPPPDTSYVEEQNQQPIIPETDSGPKQIYKTTSEVGPEKTKSNNVFSKEQAVLHIGNVGENKTIKILEISLQNKNYKIQKELAAGQSMKQSYSSFCRGLSLRVKGALIYQSSDDNFTTVRYKNLDLNCSEEVIIGIE
jgi:hypothetical protein